MMAYVLAATDEEEREGVSYVLDLVRALVPQLPKPSMWRKAQKADGNEKEEATRKTRNQKIKISKTILSQSRVSPSR